MKNCKPIEIASLMLVMIATAEMLGCAPRNTPSLPQPVRAEWASCRSEDGYLDKIPDDLPGVGVALENVYQATGRMRRFRYSRVIGEFNFILKESEQQQAPTNWQPQVICGVYNNPRTTLVPYENIDYLDPRQKPYWSISSPTSGNGSPIPWGQDGLRRVSYGLDFSVPWFWTGGQEVRWAPAMPKIDLSYGLRMAFDAQGKKQGDPLLASPAPSFEFYIDSPHEAEDNRGYATEHKAIGEVYIDPELPIKDDMFGSHKKSENKLGNPITFDPSLGMYREEILARGYPTFEKPSFRKIYVRRSPGEARLYIFVETHMYATMELWFDNNKPDHGRVQYMVRQDTISEWVYEY